MEKFLPIATGTHAPTHASPVAALRVILFTSITVILCLTWMAGPISERFRDHTHVSKSQCMQVPALFPANETDKIKAAYNFLFTSTFQNASIERLSSAVKVRTESFDDLGPIGEDDRWDVFYGFYEYLEKTFPRVHEHLRVEKVNTHGLLYTWEGSDVSKKPTVLMAHQDVVPVDPDTVDSWTHPPWSGYFDGTSVWGRGSSDCKNQLIGLLETLEILVEAGWEPKRTVILSFGFDEECSGTQGAKRLAAFLYDRYGDNGIAAIVDEGMGYAKAFGGAFAVPGIGEKGAIDVDIVVRTQGGHSSIPTDHTSIGILSEIVTAVEARQYPQFLADQNPYLQFLQCGAEHAPEFPKKLRKLLDHRTSRLTECSKHNDRLAQEAAKLSKESQYLLQTSQAVDMIKGGTKLNALPESAMATVDHRINIGDKPDTIRKHITEVVRPIAKKYNLTLNAFNCVKSGYHAISLSSRDSATLDVAPVSPTNVDVVTPYAIVAGSIRALYGEDTVVAPAFMTGNTDTRFYWKLTKSIFRFGPGAIKEKEIGMGKIHTVDEHLSVTNHFKVVRWFTLFLRNMDEADLDID